MPAPDPTEAFAWTAERGIQPEAVGVPVRQITASSSMKLCFKKVLGDVRAAFMSKSKEPRRNGAMQAFTYYDVLPT